MVRVSVSRGPRQRKRVDQSKKPAPGKGQRAVLKEQEKQRRIRDRKARVNTAKDKRGSRTHEQKRDRKMDTAVKSRARAKDRQKKEKVKEQKARRL